MRETISRSISQEKNCDESFQDFDFCDVAIFEISIFANFDFRIFAAMGPPPGAGEAPKKVYVIFAERRAARRRRPAHTCLLRQKPCAVDVRSF